MSLTAGLSQSADNKNSIEKGLWLWRFSFWPAQFAVWGAYSMFPIFLWLSGALKNPDALALAMARPVSGFLVTAATRPLWKSITKKHFSSLTFGLLIVSINLPLAFIDYHGCILILKSLGFFLTPSNAPELMTGFFALRWATLASWALLYILAKQAQHNTALQHSSKVAEMQILRAQIHPHFLFNALNSVIASAKRPDDVREITQSLADFLRFSLQQHNALEPLEKELSALENYLRVQKVRFAEDLIYHLDSEPEARACLCPSFLILPLLENALKYGLQTSPRPLVIYVAASIRKNYLNITVKNTGKWVEPNSATSLNTGILNLKKRLLLLYESKASLSIAPTEDGILATICLPLSQKTS